MKREITQEQINTLLQTIYQTNMSAQIFDAVKKMLLELPVVKREEPKVEKVAKKEVK